MDIRHSDTKPIVERVAGWSARHRKIAIVGWLLFVALAFTLGQHLGGGNVNQYDPGQAGQAERVLASPVVPQLTGESVLVQSRSGPGFDHDPRARQAVTQIVAALRRLPTSDVTDIRSPLTSTGMINGRSALVTFDVPDGKGKANQAVVPAMNAVAAVAARHPGLVIEEAGGASVDRAIGSAAGQDFRRAEVTSVPVSLVLLLIAFGALMAAGIPLLLAGTAVISAISLLAIPGRWVPIDSTTSSIVLLVGMAVGIDYSLFYLRRVREERVAGRTTGEAVAIAAATSGRAIAISGLTVMISLAGLFLTGFSVFTGVAIGTMLVVGVAVLGSLTFLPALLSALRTGTDRGRIPFLGRRQAAARRSRLWGLVVAAVVRRPLALGGLAVVALVTLAVPLVSLHLEDAGLHDLPASVPVVRNLLDIQRAFPGGPSPAQVVVTGDVGSPLVGDAITRLRGEVGATHGAIREPITTELFGKTPGSQVLLVNVPLAGNGTDAA
jgi:RND superfamily putative drug exporter